MEIKTEFNLGDKVWFVTYYNFVHECPVFEEEVHDVKPKGVVNGEIIGVKVDILGFNTTETYNISCGDYKNCQYVYNSRKADRVYATKEEAEKAYADELYEYEIERRVKRQELLEWIKEHYGVDSE